MLATFAFAIIIFVQVAILHEQVKQSQGKKSQLWRVAIALTVASYFVILSTILIVKGDYEATIDKLQREIRRGR